MPRIHFLNVLEGDCNIIQHSSGRVTVIDVSNAYNDYDTPAEIAARASMHREVMRNRTNVPSGKVDYRQKKLPDNPIEYLNGIGVSSIFRFIVSHPDMDHLDGIRDLYQEFPVANTWDSANTREIPVGNGFAGYNKEDWDFYKAIRNGTYNSTRRLLYYSDTAPCDYWNEDGLKVLSPTRELVRRANASGDFNDASYVILYEVRRNNDGVWKLLFCGDSDNHSWEHILAKHSSDITNVDVLFAPHHGRDSGRSYEFLKTVNPKVTLFGNASSKHLAYDCYKPIRITNNQAGFVIIDITQAGMSFYVKNFDFARDFRHTREWSLPEFNKKFNAYFLFMYTA